MQKNAAAPVSRKNPGAVPGDGGIRVVKDLGEAAELILAGAAESGRTGTCAG